MLRKKKKNEIEKPNFFLIDIIKSGEAFEIKTGTKMPTQTVCDRCGYMSSNKLCKACMLLEGLNRGLPRLGVGKTSKAVSWIYCLLVWKLI